MARTFAVEIVTPERSAYSEEADALMVPAEEGYLGVLAGHAPLLSTLRPGEVRVRREGTEKRFVTSGGFLEVTPKKAVLLVETVEEPETIDLDRAEKARDRAKERLAKGSDVDRERALAALERAENRIRQARRGKK